MSQFQYAVKMYLGSGNVVLIPFSPLFCVFGSSIMKGFF